MKTAFVTGVTGQDGHYLSEFLIDKGYRVVGLVRRTASPKNIPIGIEIVQGDVTDPSVGDAIIRCRPDEIYHLAAMSHVGESFRIPTATFQTNAVGTLNVLQGARHVGAKFYNASTSELFGNTFAPQDERTPFAPRSPYAISKLAAYWSTVYYREAHDLFACNGILFNHESQRRGDDFVTQKVCRYVARLFEYGTDHAQTLKLGNFDARRDWGHAWDYVRGMWLMLNQQSPGDYVLATGKMHSIRDLLDVAFRCIGTDDWTPYVEMDRSLMRPVEVYELCGDASKARKIGWSPTISFEAMIQWMVDAQIGRTEHNAPATVSKQAVAR